MPIAFNDFCKTKARKQLYRMLKDFPFLWAVRPDWKDWNIDASEVCVYDVDASTTRNHNWPMMDEFLRHPIPEGHRLWVLVGRDPEPQGVIEVVTPPHVSVSTQLVESGVNERGVYHIIVEIPTSDHGVRLVIFRYKRAWFSGFIAYWAHKHVALETDA